MKAAWLEWESTLRLCKAFADSGAELRFVGGCVRDTMLGLSAHDIDAATPLPPEAVITLLEKNAIRAIPTGLAYGTVTALMGEQPFQITTLRKDTTSDGRHPQVAYTDDWQADAQRRDFTMNAIYCSPSGELFDYVGGMEDLKAGRVRFIGNPRERIEEDYLRILRFFRFYAHYGTIPLEADSIRACVEGVSGLNSLSSERIQYEMVKLLAASEPAETLCLMQENGLIKTLIGFGINHIEAIDRLHQCAHQHSLNLWPATNLAMLVLQADMVKARAESLLCGRLKLSHKMSQELEQILKAVAQINVLADDASQKKCLRVFGKEITQQATLLCMTIAKVPAIAESLWNLSQTWNIPEFPVNGNDLIALGHRSGRDLGDALKKLEERWEASDYTLTKEQLLKMC